VDASVHRFRAPAVDVRAAPSRSILHDMSDVNQFVAVRMGAAVRAEHESVDQAVPSKDDLVAAAIKVARDAGLSWGHINQVLAGRL
jgi:hypothetical protein